MATMRRRRQFTAEVLTMRGSLLTECFAMIDIETTRVGDVRERSWRGKISSLSNPEHSLAGLIGCVRAEKTAMGLGSRWSTGSRNGWA